MITQYQRWKKANNYYEIRVGKDLFNTLVITRIWGKVNSAAAKVLHTPVETPVELDSLMTSIVKQRIDRQFKRTQ